MNSSRTDGRTSQKASPLTDTTEYTHITDIQKSLSLVEEERDQARKEAWQLETTLKTLTEGVIVADTHGKVIQMNPAAIRLHGLPYNPAEQWQLNRFSDFFEILSLNGEVQPLSSWPLSRVLRGETFSELEFVIRNKQNGREWIGSYDGNPSLDSHGQLQLAILTLRDVTAHKAAQVELTRRNLEFMTLADNAPDTITRHDLHYRYMYANRAMLTITGLTPEHYIGKTYREAGMPEEQCLLFDTLLDQVRTTGQPTTTEYTFPTVTGKRYFQSRLVPEYTEDGVLTSILVISRDVTDAKELEQRKDDFISMANHELKTPLTALKGMLQLLIRKFKRQGLTSDLDAFSTMEAQVDKLTALVNELLDATKIQADRLDYADEKVDLAALTREVILQLQSAYPTHQLNVVGSTEALIQGDRDRLGQVISNLVTNAVKYSPKANQIDIYLSTTLEAVTLVVRDYGVSIPLQHQPHIFEKFYRAYTVKEKSFPGLGMGLFISKEITERLGGRIWFESSEAEGTRFYLQFPHI